MRRIHVVAFLTLLVIMFCIGCPNTGTPTTSTPSTPSPTTSPEPSPTTINLLTISGFHAPICGNTPETTIAETAQYTGTLSWNPPIDESIGTFEGVVIYTATITLTAKTGFTLNGIAANSFTVAGALRVTNGADSGVVTVRFPYTTVDGTITSANIGKLKIVPPGRFQRDGDAANVSGISHYYWMSLYEINRSQFQTVMGIDPSDAAFSSGTTDPVQMTNWYDAIAFCNKLSLREGLTPVYAVSGISDWAALAYSGIPATSDAQWDAATADWSANGYRLPTEMEWMWAAMGALSDGLNGKINTDGYSRDFAGSTGFNQPDNFVWYNRNSSGKTHPCGTKQANYLGLYDMSGNICELCWDLKAAYPSGILTDYRGTASSNARILRGGSCIESAVAGSIHIRASIYPYIRANDVGFRVVRSGD